MMAPTWLGHTECDFVGPHMVEIVSTLPATSSTFCLVIKLLSGMQSRGNNLTMSYLSRVYIRLDRQRYRHIIICHLFLIYNDNDT